MPTNTRIGHALCTAAVVYHSIATECLCLTSTSDNVMRHCGCAVQNYVIDESRSSSRLSISINRKPPGSSSVPRPNVDLRHDGSSRSQ